ncbi:MAG: hypothetical protein KY462_15820 [Actinobacteria bacterium]|nr:hypothetical protein [Actinomycetota bacterium]
MINREGFQKAMKAALDGPELKDVEWTKFGHDFNVKKISVSKTSDGLKIDGGDGRHLSHRKRFRPDDQCFYTCRVTKDGEVEDLEINIKSTMDILKEWFETAGEILAIVGLIITMGKEDTVTKFEPVPSSLELLDGDWESDAEFLIANIIAYATARHLPELGKQGEAAKKIFVPGFELDPDVLAKFNRAKARIAGSS